MMKKKGLQGARDYDHTPNATPGLTTDSLRQATGSPASFGIALRRREVEWLFTDRVRRMLLRARGRRETFPAGSAAAANGAELSLVGSAGGLRA